MDLATLKALKPNEYAEAANGYRRTSDMARAAHDRVGTQIAAAMRKSLKGEAASAAIKQLAELGKNFHYVQTECGLVGSALDAFSYEMEAAKKKLDAALADAKAGGLTVHADGSVGYPPGGDKDKDGRTPEGGTATGLTDETASAVGRQAANFNPNPKARLAQDCADAIARALKEATEAEGDVVPDLGRYGHGGDMFIIPSDEGFGANQMATDTQGHSGYWDEGSTSLLNQARVVAGKGEDVELVPEPQGPPEELMNAK